MSGTDLAYATVPVGGGRAQHEGSVPLSTYAHPTACPMLVLVMPSVGHALLACVRPHAMSDSGVRCAASPLSSYARCMPCPVLT
eukprot:3301554-Rhodomonas_salina.1